tara:strand:+ start:1293 stop:2576 length:1284 start_codon:yes stop_codon:yes gene_type:complete
MSLFKQAVKEIVVSLKPVFNKNPQYKQYFNIMTYPERAIKFRVLWENDHGKLQVNNGYRIQFNSSLGPYKGGLRFHPSVTMDTVKFLGFEQIFKNALTGLPMGGGKGGSDFDPKGKSDAEIRRFCKSFMGNLHKYIGPDTDVPAGDIGVGGREIGYMYGEYKKLSNTHTGVLTGKDMLFGGSRLRPEATGYGTVYFLEKMLYYNKEQIAGKNVIITGSGNVSQYAVEKVVELGGNVMSVSDSKGSLIFNNNINNSQLKQIQDIKLKGMSLESLDIDASYYSGSKPWNEIESNVDIVLPCATENEVNIQDAKRINELGVKYVAEGSNMGTTADAVHFFQMNNIMYGLGKAANLGGVSVSGLEMSQNSQKAVWTKEDVDQKLKLIMSDCFDICIETSQEYGKSNDLVLGANIASFLKVSEAMEKQGILF